MLGIFKRKLSFEILKLATRWEIKNHWFSIKTRQLKLNFSHIVFYCLQRHCILLYHCIDKSKVLLPISRTMCHRFSLEIDSLALYLLGSTPPLVSSPVPSACLSSPSCRVARRLWSSDRRSPATVRQPPSWTMAPSRPSSSPCPNGRKGQAEYLWSSQGSGHWRSQVITVIDLSALNPKINQLFLTSDSLQISSIPCPTQRKG